MPERRLRRIGSSIGVVIPSQFAQQLDLKVGDVVWVELKDSAIVIYPLDMRHRIIWSVAIELFLSLFLAVQSKFCKLSELECIILGCLDVV